MPRVQDDHISQNGSITPHCSPPYMQWKLSEVPSYRCPKKEFQQSSKEFSLNQDHKMKAVLLTLQSSSHKTFYFFKTFDFWCPAVNPMCPKDYGSGPIKKKYIYTRVAQTWFKKPNINTYIWCFLSLLFFNYIGYTGSYTGFMWGIVNTSFWVLGFENHRISPELQWRLQELARLIIFFTLNNRTVLTNSPLKRRKKSF